MISHRHKTATPMTTRAMPFSFPGPGRTAGEERSYRRSEVAARSGTSGNASMSIAMTGSTP